MGKIIPEVKLNPKLKKYRDCWQSEVTKYDWSNMNEEEHRKARCLVENALDNTLPRITYVFINLGGLVFLIGILYMFAIIIGSSGFYKIFPESWTFLYDFHMHSFRAMRGLGYLVAWLVIGAFVWNWLVTDRFYRREEKNMKAYLLSLRLERGFK